VAAGDKVGSAAQEEGQPRAVRREVEERVQDVTRFRAPAIAGAGRPIEMGSTRVEKIASCLNLLRAAGLIGWGVASDTEAPPLLSAS
jgi:hypothetical protein